MFRSLIRVASLKGKNEVHEISARKFETCGTQEGEGLAVPMERCSIRRLNPAKEHRHWHPGRVSQRVCGLVCRGCTSLNHQPTDSVRTPQGCQRRDPGQTLPGARTAGHFQNRKLTPGIADEGQKTYSTQYAYEVYLNNWILPRWRSYRIFDAKAVDVEAWLKTVPLARGI